MKQVHGGNSDRGILGTQSDMGDGITKEDKATTTSVDQVQIEGVWTYKVCHSCRKGLQD